MITHQVSITYRTIVETEEGTPLADVKDKAIERFMDFVRDGGDCNDIEASILEN